MSEVSSRDLRNDTAGVLRRVEAGEDITITVKGRPVAFAQRLATLESVADMESLPVDEKASRKLPVITQDDDFDGLDGAANLTIIRV